MTLAVLPHMLLIFTAFSGVILTIYIYHKKRSHEAMVCPLNGHCESVLSSEFSTFLGVPVELLGMFYYAAVAVSYGIITVIPEASSPMLTLSVFTVTSTAFLFSAYLVFIQVMYLKQLCTWCLLSAGLSTLIFILTIIITGSKVLPIFAEYPDILQALYSIGLALGIGGAIVTTIFLVKFLQDLHISQIEAVTVRTTTQVSWLGLALVVLSVFGIVFSAISHPFSWSHLTILLILLICGAVLDLIITPKLISISLQEKHDHMMGELKVLRKMAFLLSGITLVSWFTIFVMNSITYQPTPALLAIVYAVLLCGSIGVSLLLASRPSSISTAE